MFRPESFGLPSRRAFPRAPALFDVRLLRDCPAGRRLKFRFRAEAFNLSNTPGFGAPNSSLTSPSFGQVTPQQANGPRIVQLALRLMF